MIDSLSLEEEKDIISLKVTLVGSSTVGKSALINQYINNKFLETPIVTIGCDKFSKIEKINDLIIKLNLWDTAGQESFRAITKMFYKGADIVILVYDITDEKSFNEIKNFWYNEVKNNTDNLSGKNIIIIFFIYYFFIIFSYWTFWK